MSVRRAAFLLAAAAWASAATATTFPQTVEVDLVFPRNETYAPSDVFPIVFAFQNAPLVPSLDPDFDLMLWQNLDHDNAISLYSGGIDLSGANFSATASDVPLYVYTFVTNINTTNNGTDASTQYNFVWSFSAGNCSSVNDITTLGGGYISSNVIFTIAQTGGTTPDIAPTADSNSSSTCGLSHLAFNFTGTLPVSDPTKYDGHSSCAVLSETTPTPVGNPCAATADAAAASSISAAMTSEACAAETPAISCPAKSSGAAAIYIASAWTGCIALLFAMVL